MSRVSSTFVSGFSISLWDRGEEAKNHTHSHPTIAALATKSTEPLHGKPKLSLPSTEVKLPYRQHDTMLDPDCSPKMPPSPAVPDDLTSGEKYSHAKMRLEPLLQELSTLPSANYYQELTSLETTLKMEIKPKTRSDSTDAATVDSGGENLGEKMEGSVAGDPADSHVKQSPQTKPKEVLQSRLKNDVRLDDFDQWARHTSNVKDVAALMEKYPMQLKEQDITASTVECQWEAMRRAAYMHAFVLPVNLTHALEDAIKTARIVQKQPDPLDARVKNQGIVLDLVASVSTTTLKFSGAYVGALTAFYSMKNKARLWINDIKWLEQDWRNVKVDVDIVFSGILGDGMDLFGPETGTAEFCVGGVCARHQILANDVISKFSSSSLASEFVTTSGKGRISFDNLAGGVCEGWLNDAPINFCMEMLSEVVGQCYALSSLTTAVGFPRAPTTPISIEFILLPVHLHGNQWGVIIAQLHYAKATDKLSVCGYLYGPLIDDAYHEDMEAKWNGITDTKNELVQEGLRGFVERWHQVCSPRARLLMKPFKWIHAPLQPDYSSCGVMVVAHAYSFLTRNLLWQQTNVSKSDVKVMRLRMLWLIMCKSRRHATADKVKNIHQQLLVQLK